MFVKLLTTGTQIADMEYNAAYAMLTCHDNTHKLKDEKPEVFVKRAIKAHHDTVLEHIWLTYEVRDLSRACLQELARHRHITLSVESTRHTLKKKLVDDFIENEVIGNDMDKWEYLGWFRNFASKRPDITNDELKYYLPEFWPTNLVMTANVRELRHIINLRTSPAALKEFQDLARKFVEVVPERFKYLLEDCVHKKEDYSMIELKTLDYAPERDRLYRMKDAAPEMYKFIESAFLTKDSRHLNWEVLVKSAGELLARIDEEEKLQA